MKKLKRIPKSLCQKVVRNFLCKETLLKVDLGNKMVPQIVPLLLWWFLKLWINEEVCDKYFEKKIVRLWPWITFCYRKSMLTLKHLSGWCQIEWLFESYLGSFGYVKFSTVLWLPLDPSCKGNLLTRVGWLLQAH